MGSALRVFSDTQQIQVSPYFTMKLLFPIAVVLLVFVSCSEVAALQCYQCSALQDWCVDGDADEHKDDKPYPSVVDCKDDQNRCVLVSYEADDKEIASRGCGKQEDYDVDDDCKEEDIPDGNGNKVTGTLCVCDSNLCNTAQRFGLNINLGVVITAFIVMKLL